MDLASVIHYLAFVPAILVAITGHEFAHARVALWFGDTTAFDEGRVTLNPLAHLDPIGTFGMLFLGFGWGKPVPVNTHRLRHPRADLLVSAAGPGANLLAAILFALPLRMPPLMDLLYQFDLGHGAVLLFSTIVHFNLVLAFFNLLPLYPLDGSHVVQNLLPLNAALRFNAFSHRYGQFILLGVILSGYVLPVSIASLLLGPPLDFVEALLLDSSGSR